MSFAPFGIWHAPEDYMPEPGDLIVKCWKSKGSTWSGVYSGSAKDSSFDAWMKLPNPFDTAPKAS